MTVTLPLLFTLHALHALHDPPDRGTSPPPAALSATVDALGLDAPDVAPLVAGASRLAEVTAPGAESLDNPPPPPMTRDEAKKAEVVNAITSYEMLLSLMVLAFGIIVVLLQFLLLRRRRAGAEDAVSSPADVMRVFTISVVVIGTLFAITAGFSSEQVAPAMGLYGTLAGYLLGRGDRRANDAA